MIGIKKNVSNYFKFFLIVLLFFSLFACDGIAPTTYILTSFAGSGGSINPEGTVSVSEGANQTFTITADEDYQITDVLIDGVSIGAAATYTFNDIQEDHTILVSFNQSIQPPEPTSTPKYTITASAGTGGSITPEGMISVNKGSDQVFTIEEDTGYQIADVLVDGVSVGAVNIYIFNNVSKDYTIEVSFVSVYTLTMSVIGEGTTTPAVGTHTYPSGTIVDLAATSSCLCYSFNKWSGSLTGNINPTTITMDSDKSVTANFSVIAKKVYNVDTTIEYPTIQEAIDAALDGETIMVCPGIYYVSIVFDGRDITLQSANPENLSIVAVTILDGWSSGSVVEFSGGDTSTLKGFTIQGGDAFEGGGIHIHGASSPTIDGNIITGNMATDNGAGIYIGENSSPTISKNAITSNYASGTSGGGITVDGASSPTITGNTIIGNMAMAGGGIFVFGASSPTITGNTITGHSVQYSGGGIYVSGGSCFIIDGNTITGNSAEERGGGIYVSGGASATISNNTIHYNMAQIYGGGIFVGWDSNLLPSSSRTTGWGVGRENIPTTALDDPTEGIEYEIAGNTFLENEHGSPLDYTEGAHVYFDID